MTAGSPGATAQTSRLRTVRKLKPLREFANSSARTAATPGVGFWVSVFAVVALHVSLTLHFVDAAEVFSDRPLQGTDYDLHIGQVYRVVDALSGWGESWAYDVELLAGQPEGAITDAGSKGWELWTYALVSMGVVRSVAFNSFVLVVMLAAPLSLFGAALLFGSSRRGALIAAAMTSSLWFFDSHIHWVWFVGMVSWAGASCLAALTLSLFHRMLERRRLSLALACAPCLGLCLLIHPYTFFVLAVPMAACYLRAWRGLAPAGHAAIAAIAACALAINAYWLVVAARHWHYILDSAFYAQASPVHLLCDWLQVLCSGEDTGVIGARTGFRFLYLALAIAGLWCWRQRGAREFMPLALAIGMLYAIAYLGGFMPGMQQTQPYRQITPAILLSCLPAAAFVDAQLEARSWRELRGPTRAVLLVLGFALVSQLIASQVLYFLPRLIPDPKLHSNGARSLVSKYGFLWPPGRPAHIHYGVPHDPDEVELGAGQLIDWIEGNVPPGSRLLVENATLGERLAWKTDIEVLGGFFERNLQHVDANFFRAHRGKADPRELANYLRTFAVDAVVTSREDVSGLRGVLERVATIRGQRVYRVNVPLDRVLRGGGTVSASMNRIRVRGSRPNEVLELSYHWHESLRCKPSCRVERARVPIDRVGFIRVPAPHPSDLEIYNSYE